MKLQLEHVLLGLEAAAAKGTAVRPTDYLEGSGIIRPVDDDYAPESRGVFAKQTRSALVRRSGTFEMSGGLDTDAITRILQMTNGAAASADIVQQGGTAAYLWSLAPSQTADDRLTATFWWGDPQSQ
ncbi:hypothetical protein KDA23_06050, partial [Candidatus Saccharibacteria bacterium]|nr:hypothetical protein [Candidatus Saccharibacteria bacterium]